MDFKTHIIEVPCPQCDKPTQETVGMLERASSVVCAHCGHVICVNGDLLRGVLDALLLKRARSASEGA
jgi:hypothetical protein